MSHFLDSISTIINVFHEHVKEDGGCSNISQRKMRELIQREFADVIANPHDPQMIYKILQFLDWDDDGEIDFNEFLLLVFRVAKACYWYQPKAPCLLQRTKLTASDKSLREPEVKNRGSHWHQQEEERKTCESNHHPPGQHKLQQDSRINEIETVEEMGSHHQQLNTQSRNSAKRSTEPGEPILQVYEEQSQEPQDQRNSQRRRGDVQLQKRSNLQAHHTQLEADERQNQERPQPKQLAEVRNHNQKREPQPLPKQCRSHKPNEPALQVYDQKNHHPQETDRGSYNQPHKAELLMEERSWDHLHEPEHNELEDRSQKRHALQRLDSRCLHQSYIQEPIEIELRYSETRGAERDISEQRRNQEYQLKNARQNQQTHETEQQEHGRKEEPERERRTDHQPELELDVYECHSCQTQEREEQGATRDQREARERHDSKAYKPKDNGTRPRESAWYETTRDTTVVAAEADVKIHHISRELEPPENLERRDRPCERQEPGNERRICPERQREKPEEERRIDHKLEREMKVYEHNSHQTQEREGRGATSDQREARERRDHQTYEPEDNGRRPHESMRYERTWETAVLAAEADVKIHRVSRELEPRENLGRRDRPREHQERVEERRICPERQREVPEQERRVDRQMELEVYDHHRRQTQEREGHGVTRNQREARKRHDRQTHDTEDNGRRPRESVQYERARETAVAAAEADVKIHHISREMEPHEDGERRDRLRERQEPEDERRTCQERQREEPKQERRINHQWEMEDYECCNRQTREREEQGATSDQREARERRDHQTHEPEDYGRTAHELERYERAWDAAVVAAEADVKIHHISRKLEPRENLKTRDCPREHQERVDGRRICPERQREKPEEERRIDHHREWEMKVYECNTHQTQDREEQGATSDQREASERRDHQIYEPEDYGRRPHESMWYERTRETAVLAAAEDVKIHCVYREPEPHENLERRDRPREHQERVEERMICPERQREESKKERRINHQRERELEVYEHHRRQTRETEWRSATSDQREACERHDRETYEPEDCGRRPHDSVQYERTRETVVVAAEADVKIHHISRELEPHEDGERRDRTRERQEPEDERRICQERQREEPKQERRIDQQLELEDYEHCSRQTRERQEQGATSDQREACERRDHQTHEPEDYGRGPRELGRYERARDAAVVAAGADVKINHISREPEPRENLERRDRPREHQDRVDERRICSEREREESKKERKIDHQREMELDVYERRSRQTRERQEQGATRDQREASERCDHQTYEPEDNGRRPRDLVRYERARETAVVAAEADVKIHRVSREMEPHEKLERRDCPREHQEPGYERRICQERQREEPKQERRINHQRELEDYECCNRQTKERQEQGATRDQREACKRRDHQTHEPEDYGRTARELGRYERVRNAAVVAAEADVKIHHVSREQETHEDGERRDRPREHQDRVDERRICSERQREESKKERRIDHQRERELEVYEHHRRQTREREGRGATSDQRDASERCDHQTYEPEDDERRPRDLVRYERTRETAVVAAEADVKIHRVSRELEPHEKLERRDCPREHQEPGYERRICPDGQREEPKQEGRVDRQREQELKVYEHHRRQTRETEWRGATSDQREARERHDRETYEPEDYGRRPHDSVQYERTRETVVVAAEADVKIHHISRELEPHEDGERRDPPHERQEPEDERRICQERQREEPKQERRIDRQLELEDYEHCSRQTRERQEQGATRDQREARERRDHQTHEPEDYGRGPRELGRYERARDAAVVAAEADVKIHHISREPEPRENLERRDRPREHQDRVDERRICSERQREESKKERRIDHQQEMELDVYERRSRQTREREEQGATRDQREACERRDHQTHEPEDYGRGPPDLVRYERVRDAAVVAAGADVKIHHISREPEPRENLERRDRPREHQERVDERRVCRGREREDPRQERRIKHQQHLVVF